MTRRHPIGRDDSFHRAPLAALPELIWSLLARAVKDSTSPFHTPVLATVNKDAPEARTVVLRHADPMSRQITCHTDWRSPKRKQVQAHRQVAWLFYDPTRRLQLRLRGQGTVHYDDSLARERWDGSPAHSRMCYSSPLAPGAPVEAPMAAPTNVHDGWQYFAVLTCRVDYMDWLFLRAAGHRRAVLRWDQDAWSGNWVAP